MTNIIDDLCFGGEFNGGCTLTPFTLDAQAAWAVRNSIPPIPRTTTWAARQGVGVTRQSFWNVKSSCRGARTFRPYDQSRVLSTHPATSALVASVTVCLLSPRTRTILETPDHKGRHAIVAQTKNLYLDDLGNVYIKGSDALLGELQSLSPLRSGAFAGEVLKLASLLKSQGP